MESWKEMFLMCADLNKQIIDRNLYNLSKELKKEFGRDSRFELIIIGGAAIAMKHDFREATKDIDALISAGSGSVKGAIYRVAEQNNLPDDWLNTDFKKTKSYSQNIVVCSKYYKTYNQILDVRVLDDEYLLAMKLCSFRAYKHDRSDIVGTLMENPNITKELVEFAVKRLYGSLDSVSNDAWCFLDKVIGSKEKQKLYNDIVNTERNSKALLENFDQNYHGALQEQNIEDVLEILQRKEQTRLHYAIDKAVDQASRELRVDKSELFVMNSEEFSDLINIYYRKRLNDSKHICDIFVGFIDKDGKPYIENEESFLQQLQNTEIKDESCVFSDVTQDNNTFYGKGEDVDFDL